MTEPTAHLESSNNDESSSIEPWLVPVVAAGLAGGLADCAGAAILYNVYLRVHNVVHPPLFRDSRPIPGLMTFFSSRAFVFAMGWAVAFAIVYGMQDSIRRRMQSIGGFATVSVLFGTVMWLVMRTVVSRGNLEEPMLSIIGLLTYVLFAAPAIAWTLRRALQTKVHP
ncbi:MAG TPA: hypothetical protein VJW73_13825 [Gemmatimonadaceae bacterium]|nr:hypothetical protein [Gemmatimonadaceae bacterium]